MATRNSGTRKPAPRKAPARRPGPQRPPGDVTGRKAEELGKQAAAATAQREAELGMVTARQRELKDGAIVDLTEPGNPTVDGTRVATDAGDIDYAAVDRTDEQGTEANSNGQATYSVTELPEEESHTPDGGVSGIPKELLEEPSVIRCLYEAENVTIGYGNNYTLREGYRYKVPFWVAIHLEEKGIALIMEAPTQLRLANA